MFGKAECNQDECKTSFGHWLKDIISARGLSKCAAVFAATMLSGCLATMPTMGGGQGGGTVTGAAGGATASNNNSQLESCDEPLGTVSVFEDRDLPWWEIYTRQAPDLGSTIPVIRLMIQQSNCFLIVERGAAMRAMQKERELMAAGASRQGSNFGKGQMVAADYTLSPSIQFSAKGTAGVGAIAGAFFGKVGTAVAGGFKKNEAATTLLLIDNRSGVQVSAAVGNAKNYDFSMFGGLGGGGGLAGAGGFSKSPQGKIITASFADSYNQMVEALRNYKTQTVKGGLGKGGRLGVAQ